uniref:Deoxyribonuclease n=1 Tax=Astatotilapia calliptera TaxID=8154 RepID=A0A3P8R6S4_ASTCA
MKIASFNAQRFGLTKVSDPAVLTSLVKLGVIILEVVNVTGDSVRVLVEELNGVSITHHYAQQLSTRLGRSRYKEQFLFLYRDDVVDLIDCYQYKDDQVDDVDAFKREPYILYFKTHNTGQSLPLLKLMVPGSNVMILGDFRADGWYLSSKEREEIHIRSDKNSYWLIGDNVDTRAKTSDHHAYDRIVVYGEDMLAAIVPNSAKPFNFHKEFQMTEEMGERSLPLVDTQQGFRRAVTGKEQNTNILYLVPDRCGKSWDTTQLRKLDGKFT